VFGEVVSGLDVVKAVEKTGSRDGKVPSDKKAVVKACGTV
jgi:peptidylprolyl isomerase